MMGILDLYVYRYLAFQVKGPSGCQLD